MPLRRKVSTSTGSFLTPFLNVVYIYLFTNKNINRNNRRQAAPPPPSFLDEFALLDGFALLLGLFLHLHLESFAGEWISAKPSKLVGLHLPYRESALHFVGALCII